MAQDQKCSQPRVAKLMKQAGIVAKMHKLFTHYTSYIFIYQNFTTQAPNQVWVAGISYIATI
jgi:transposase InsO family protein